MTSSVPSKHCHLCSWESTSALNLGWAEGTVLLHTKGGGWGRGAVKLPMTNTSIWIITDGLALIADAVAA
jgi:hypothetical protein